LVSGKGLRVALGVVLESLAAPLGRRWRAYVLLGAALLVLGFGVSGGVAKSGPGQVRVPIIADSFPGVCPGGHGAKHKKLGTVTAIREKGNATFRGQVHRALAGSYAVNLYDGDCTLLLRLGSFSVDGGGDGSFARRLLLSFGQVFFLDFYNQDQDVHNATPLFKLGSSGISPGAPGSDLGVTKTVSDASPNVGDAVTFTVTVANGGPFTATGVTVADLLPAGLTFVSATPSEGAYDAATGVWTVGAVATGAPQTLVIKATVASVSPVSNTATITHADQFDPNPGNNTATVGLQAQSADLALTKTVGNASPNVGDAVTFTLTVSDAGPDAATGVAVTDLLPAGLTFLSATPSEGTYNAATGVWTIGTVTTGAPQTLQLLAKVVSPSAQTNTATVSHADQLDPVTSNNTASATETPTQADLGLAKTVSDSTPNVGDTVTFTVTLSDGGPGAATSVQVTDLLPAGLSFVSATPSQGTYASATGVWDVGTVTTGSPQTLQLLAKVVSPSAQTNTASASHADQLDPNAGNNAASATETPKQADLGLAKTISDSTPNVGDTVTFTVTLSNGGPGAATGVQVSDLLPAGLSFVSATPSQGSYNSATGLWNVGTVTTITPQTLQIVGKVVSASAQTNTASVSHADQLDPNAGNNTASATETPQIADLAVTKFVVPPVANLGQFVTFNIVLTDNGPATATGVTVADLLPLTPQGLLFVSATPSQGSYNPGTGVWTVGTVAPGPPATLAITAQVVPPPPPLPPWTNTATITHADQFDPDTGNNTASAAVQVPADLELSKTVTDPTPNVGDPIAFIVTLTNLGPSEATGVVVSDPVPAGLGGVVVVPNVGTYDMGTGLWTLPTIVPGPVTLVISAVVLSPDPVTNTATIAHADEFDPNPANNTASATETPQQADLALTKTVDDPNPLPGGTVHFTLTLTNNGPDPATNVTVTDLLPPNFTFVSALISQGTYNSATGEWALVFPVDAGFSKTLTLTATVNAVPSTNSATITHSDQFDPVTGNNTASVGVT
jgi:uncharacterized repeat protein (TIGR01451 family)